MSDWFGKAENGMHVMCVLFKEGDRLVKKAYLKGKASQGVGFVMAVYGECLKQLAKDVPRLHYIIDKSDNAGCYHTEMLFTWKAYWSSSHTGHIILQTSLNERQADKLVSYWALTAM